MTSEYELKNDLGISNTPISTAVSSGLHIVEVKSVPTGIVCPTLLDAAAIIVTKLVECLRFLVLVVYCSV